MIHTDLTNGSVTQFVNLTNVGTPGIHFANDATVDENGVIYVTDSGGAQIWRIDSNGTATTVTFLFMDYSNPQFVTDARWVPDITGLGLNGIDYRNGYIVTVMTSGTLYKLPINNPYSVTRVNLNRNIPSGIK